MSSKKNKSQDKTLDAAQNSSNVEAVQKSRKPLDFFLWVMIIIAVVGAVVGNYYFSQPANLQPLYIRIILVLGCIAVGLVCGLLTTVGRKFVKFAKESRGELRRVSWPTREETTKSTMGVAVVVFLIAMFLWFADVVIGFLVSLITNV